jgi:hypothetical protein
VECRCPQLAELYGDEAEDYVAGHLVSEPDDAGAFVCPDTGKRWILDYPEGGQARLRLPD